MNTHNVRGLRSQDTRPVGLHLLELTRYLAKEDSGSVICTVISYSDFCVV